MHTTKSWMPQKNSTAIGCRGLAFQRTFGVIPAKWAMTVICSVTLFAGLLIGPHAMAGDWPQILGPRRNGVAEGETLLKSWPDAGPKILWKTPLGTGYAGAAVRGGHVVVFHRIGNDERLESFDLQGKSRWKVDFSATYRGGFNPDLGPRCTPVIHGDRVIAYGANGDLHCVRLADGKKLWSRALLEDYRAPESYFGAGSSPIALGNRVYVNLGARDGGLVALDLKDGATYWAKTEEPASYSSPTLIPFGGQTALFFVTRYKGICVRPDDGNILFSFPFGKRGPTVNAATPILAGKDLFVTSSYGVGAALYRLQPKTPQRVWGNDETMSSQYATPVYANGYLYGCDGREDIGVASFRCIKAATGEVQWTQEGLGVSHALISDDLLLLQTASGEIRLAKATPEKFENLGQAQVASEPTRAVPALSQGRLFVRATGNAGGHLICIQVGEIADAD